MRRKIAFLTLIAMLAFATAPVYAGGTIRIDPCLPAMVSSPATFAISDVSKVDYVPQILLVMTVASYNGLSGDVLVTWTGGSITFHELDFELAEFGGPKIPFADEPVYTVASCADHLGVSGNDVYYAYAPFLDNNIDSTPQSFTITASSTALRMLVYAIAREGSETGAFSFVPPTQPGFVVPELATILLSLAPFGAFGLYMYKRKKL
jgi:hypothetical protein